MFKNRIARYLSEIDADRTAIADAPPTPPLPPGFVAVPRPLSTPALPGLSAGPFDPHRMAYESARLQVRERLLALLRSRQGLAAQ